MFEFETKITTAWTPERRDTLRQACDNASSHEREYHLTREVKVKSVSKTPPLPVVVFVESLVSVFADFASLALLAAYNTYNPQLARSQLEPTLHDYISCCD